MQVLLSKQEREWIDKKPFDWSIKEGCPPDIRKRIERKLQTIKDFENQERTETNNGLQA